MELVSLHFGMKLPKVAGKGRCLHAIKKIQVSDIVSAEFSISRREETLFSMKAKSITFEEFQLISILGLFCILSLAKYFDRSMLIHHPHRKVYTGSEISINFSISNGNFN